MVPPFVDVPADEAPCNIGNPPAERSPSYDEVPHPDGARLLNDEERQRAMDGRWKGRTREGGAPIGGFGGLKPPLTDTGRLVLAANSI